jgi:hypothetical protein
MQLAALPVLPLQVPPSLATKATMAGTQRHQMQATRFHMLSLSPSAHRRRGIEVMKERITEERDEATTRSSSGTVLYMIVVNAGLYSSLMLNLLNDEYPTNEHITVML